MGIVYKDSFRGCFRIYVAENLLLNWSYCCLWGPFITKMGQPIKSKNCVLGFLMIVGDSHISLLMECFFANFQNKLLPLLINVTISLILNSRVLKDQCFFPNERLRPKHIHICEIEINVLEQCHSCIDSQELKNVISKIKRKGRRGREGKERKRKEREG